MNKLSLITPIALVAITFSASASVEARTAPHTMRASSMSAASTTLAPLFTNAAGDISFMPPVGWDTTQSETWTKSSDGTEEYSENVSLSDANGVANVQISAVAAGDDTLENQQETLESYYDEDSIVSSGMTMLGTDPAFLIESKDNYTYTKEYLVIKNGWEYDVIVAVDAKKWKKYSGAVNASIASLRFNLVP